MAAPLVGLPLGLIRPSGSPRPGKGLLDLEKIVRPHSLGCPTGD